MVHKSVMFSNVIVDIPFPRHSFVFSQSSCEVSASLTDVGGVAVGAIDLIYCSLSVPRWEQTDRVTDKELIATQDSIATITKDNNSMTN